MSKFTKYVTLTSVMILTSINSFTVSAEETISDVSASTSIADAPVNQTAIEFAPIDSSVTLPIDSDFSTETVIPDISDPIDPGIIPETSNSETEEAASSDIQNSDTEDATSSSDELQPDTEDSSTISDQSETTQTTDVSQVTPNSQVTNQDQEILDVSPASPIYTNTGYQIISTQNSRVIVAYDDGTTDTLEAAAIGGTVNEDQTISIRTASGEMKTLPVTGEKPTLLMSFSGFIFLILAWIFCKKNIKITD